ncbi:MAG: 2-oxoglutarate dehydrogenase complex dihydrolipoyllysine-residue succinyltransferase [Lentimicrobium sp.]|jgi:2-oxoglutarate dehydrogenase E2 component (dihydrolipoamide succinyltransferase)|nr:2-oxoglutarate dehydrogenase complex dihydrolipoyllysine-residue succinyltransferase [Lentimicrobium sp.]
MIIEVKVPSPGESISEVQLATWLVSDGDFVEKDAEIAEIDSDKATLTVNAAESGVIKLLAEAGDTLKVGSVVARIDASAARPKGAAAPVPAKAESPAPEKPTEQPKNKPEEKSGPSASGQADATEPGNDTEAANMHISPLARRIMLEKNVSAKDIEEYIKRIRIGKGDIEEVAQAKGKPIPSASVGWGGSRDTERKKMSALRQKLAQRLVTVKNETAMLTTFNEVNMSRIMAIRKEYNEKFKQKHGVSLGFMSLFTKAITIALGQYPQVNSMIDGDEMITYNYADIGIAVSAPKGLVVPVVRNAESLSLAEIELKIKELATKARDNRITLDEMTGGTFTITNGGVFGSMLSTPILNPPQSAILGMHNIIERPIALNGQVVIAPMMYVALSYDHRVIDGKESVSFLVKVKELLENPESMLYGGANPLQALLAL